jgi:two-component system, cell cycle sensor histidine kinase and response regulator CckA
MVAPNRGKTTGLAALRGGQASRDTGAGPGESGMRPATTRPRRVLLVEDEDMVRKVVSRMLTSRGYEVHAAASGTEAMALFDGAESQDFDLLVTDLMMPDGGGLGVARNLTARVPGLRVLLVSGYSATGTEGWDPARFRFLTKPFGSAELSRAIDELFLSHPAV